MSIFSFFVEERKFKIFDRCFAINTRKVLGVGGEGGGQFCLISRKQHKSKQSIEASL